MRTYLPAKAINSLPAALPSGEPRAPCGGQSLLACAASGDQMIAAVGFDRADQLAGTGLRNTGDDPDCAADHGGGEMLAIHEGAHAFLMLLQETQENLPPGQLHVIHQ